MNLIHFFILIGLIGLVVAILLNHRRLVKKTQLQLKERFIQIDLELQKRNVRIPELIEISKSSLSQERPLLEAVVQTRNQASSALQKASLDPSSSEAINTLHLAEKEFQETLRQFLNKISTQANLMNQPKMVELLKIETDSQKKISTAIESYNHSITNYNNHFEHFPGSLLTPLLGLEKATPFRL